MLRQRSDTSHQQPIPFEIYRGKPEPSPKEIRRRPAAASTPSPKGRTQAVARLVRIRSLFPGAAADDYAEHDRTLRNPLELSMNASPLR